jgi:hypothetical protein
MGCHRRRLRWQAVVGAAAMLAMARPTTTQNGAAGVSVVRPETRHVLGISVRSSPSGVSDFGAVWASGHWSCGGCNHCLLCACGQGVLGTYSTRWPCCEPGNTVVFASVVGAGRAAAKRVAHHHCPPPKRPVLTCHLCGCSHAGLLRD